MNEIVYKIDNWTLIKLIGGIGVIVIGFFSLFGKLILERAKVIWTRNANSELQDLKANLDKYNSNLIGLQTSHLFHVQNSHNKRIEAIEVVWSALLEIKQNIPSPIGLCLQILADEQFTNEILDKAGSPGGTYEKSFGKVLSQMDEAVDTFFVARASYKVDNVRPFLNPDLYDLYKTYTGVVGRTLFQFIWHYKKDKLTCWKNDETITNLLKQVLNEKEYQYILSVQIGSFNTRTNLLEVKMLDKMNTTITGTDRSSDTIKHIKTLETIWKVEQR